MKFDQEKAAHVHHALVKELLDGAKKMPRRRLESAYLAAMHNNVSACDELYRIWDAVEARGYANSLAETKTQMVFRAIRAIPLVHETFPSS